MGEKTLSDWYGDHKADYAAVVERLAGVRAVTLAGDLDRAAENLRRSYVNAVLSIRTNKDRHERGFAHWRSGADVRTAALETVYGGQKADWIERTFESTDFRMLALAVRAHWRNGRTGALLDMHEQLTGVALRKWSFTLAMSGVWEVCCIDSNVGNYCDIGEREYGRADGSEYARAIERVGAQIDEDIPPFVVQWAIYDFERGEHARHMPYFNEVHGA
jgi:hypothetical protein